MSLTKLDIIAIRKADTILFSHMAEAGEVICIKRPSNKEKRRDPWAADKKYRVKVGSNLDARHKAFYSTFAESLTMLKAFIRVGDDLTLNWRESAGNNQLTRDAGLASDMLYIDVFRKDKEYTALLKQSITKDDSARMIKCKNG